MLEQFIDFSKTYNTIELLKVIAAMQLLPTNHSKNVRLEHLARTTLANRNEGAKPVPLDELKRILDDEFPESEYEDRPVNLFTENINFTHGNYIVFPGTATNVTTVLNNLLKAIFCAAEDKKLPKEFIYRVNSAAFLLLSISDIIAKKCGFHRNHSERIKDRLIDLPTPEHFDTLSKAVVFSHTWLLEYSKTWGTDPEIIKEFLIDPNDPNLFGIENDYSPLQYFPILKTGDEYLVIQPTSVPNALVNFIWKDAEKRGYKLALLSIFNDTVWLETSVPIANMLWLPTGMKLPESKPELRCRENVYLIDLNKCAYVCFVDSGYYRQVSRLEDVEVSEEILAHGNFIQERQTEVITYLKKECPDHEFLTLFIVSEVGFSQGYAIPSSEINYISLAFTSTELLHLINYFEEPEPLMLWKFAKAYLELTQNCKIVNIGGILDAFAAYFEHNYSFWPKGEERPGLMCFTPGMCSNFVRTSILKMDIHSALYLEDGQMYYCFVHNYCDYGPFYALIGDRLRTSVYLEGFIVPIWFINDQRETHHERQIRPQLEMFAFWLNKLKAGIDEHFALLTGDEPIMVHIHLDTRYKKEMRVHEIPIIPLDSVYIPIEFIGSICKITIPLELAHWFATPDNEAERKILSSFLNAILVPKDGEKERKIQELIDLEMPKGPAKMVNMLGANNLQLENRHLPTFRPLSEHEVSNIQVNITRSFKVKADPEDLLTRESKSKLASRIATTLHDQLVVKLQEYDPLDMVPILLNYNEACVQQRAVQALDIPPRLSCLGYHSYHAANLFIKEQGRIKTALAVRCLIEFIVADENTTGKKLTNFDDLDELIALMYEMISWAGLSDTIKLGLQDPEMKLLACGRIDVDFDSINDIMLPLTLTKSQIEIDHHNKEFEHLFTQQDSQSTNPNHPEAVEINDAFKKEWGVSFSDIYNFIMDLVHFTRLRNGSTVATDQDSLYEVLQNEEYKWKNEEITYALNVLCLISGWKAGSPPNGYDKSDTYPWRYNRALSFIRRPIVRLTVNEITYYMWSYRHILAAFDNLMTLLTQGILWSPEGGPISKIVKKMNDKKGKAFRNQVCEWFSANTSFEVIPYEVRIGPRAPLHATENLGDIDVMAIDRVNKIVYSIECKNTTESKTPVEFTLEINKYLGSGDKLAKHIKRDEWLKNNLSQLNIFLKDQEVYAIRSVIITAFELPLIYLNKNLALPFISLPKLNMIETSGLEKLFQDGETC